MFDSTKDDLKAILRQGGGGALQLPDFQRDYVWDEQDVRSLIESLAKGFPIGALLTLETGGPVQFKPRLLAGVPPTDTKPDHLLLDGQQRMTSLYQALISKEPLRTRTPKGKEIERYFYLDIEKVLSEGEDFDNALVGVPRDRVVRTNFGKTVVLDLSSQEKEFELSMFPLNKVFEWYDWLFPWQAHWKEQGRDVFPLANELRTRVLEVIDDYKMPIIKLDRSNSREAICLVFEKVNVGGKKLDAFELVTALYAGEGFDLREDWNGSNPSHPSRRLQMTEHRDPKDVLNPVANTDFLQACTLLHTMDVRSGKEAEGLEGRDLPQVSCRRDALLGLPLSSYQAYADGILDGFLNTRSFLNANKIMWSKDTPYQPQLIGLAAVFARLGHSADSAAVKDKLGQWFWCVALGELYGSTTESRLARDVPELIAWAGSDGPRPRSLDEALFQQDRLWTLRSRLAAAYKAISALLMRHGCQDFITGTPADIMAFFSDPMDIHHVFPQDWCKKQGIAPSRFNSIINKTPLSKRSNILVGGDAPSVYLKRIQDKEGISEGSLDAILRTHLIEPEHLRNDNFESFCEARMQALAGLVAEAMGKAVVTESGSNEVEIEPISIVPEFDEQELELAS